MRSPARAFTFGFTLIELLVVITIIMILIGMLMPMLLLAKRASLRSVSKSIMGKTEAALFQYKADFHGYPYQLQYADEGSNAQNSNTLGYNIGTDIDPSDAANVKADMAAAIADYSYANQSAANQLTFTANRGDGLAQDEGNDPDGDEYPNYWCQNNQTGQYFWVYWNIQSVVTFLNRLGAERGQELMLIGDVGQMGPFIQGCLGPAGSGLNHPSRDLTAIPLVSSPQSAARPGWAKDYLQGEIEAKYLRNSAILDAYFHPLVYICQVKPGVEPTLINGVDIYEPAIYGLQPQGRRTLEPFVPGTSTPITGDPDTLPDVSNLMHSDMRFWSPPGYELEFELWSAGPDGHFSWWRDDLSNQDNIPCEPYNHDIGTQP